MILTYRYRVKNLAGKLNGYAMSVNMAWNYCNDAQKHALRWSKNWPTRFDLNNATSGFGKMVGLNAGTVNEVCRQYVQSRAAKNRPFLRYRGKKSLGWVPVKSGDLKQTSTGFMYYGDEYKVFMSRLLPDGVIKSGTNFCQDARGNWYINIVIDIAAPAEREPIKRVGVDLGLKELATLSTGEVIENPRHYRALEEKLGKAQRANKKRRARNIHAKIANSRRDHLHKLSHRLTKEFDYIAVGNVSAKKLTKTKMAKSVHDAGWSTLRQMLAYKAIRTGARYEEVNEAFTTRTCSECGCISGPKGQAGLNERTWICSDCGYSHNRDVNSAILILRRGQATPVLGAAA